MDDPDRRAAETTIQKALLTLAEAARALSIDRRTLLKWHACGHIRIVRIGPAGHSIPRVPASEIARLKVA